MLTYYLKTLPHKKIFQFQDRFCFFFIKNTKKTTTHQQVTGGKIPNLALKRIQELFYKNSTTQENIRISRLKEDYKTYTKKENFKQKTNQ